MRCQYACGTAEHVLERRKFLGTIAGLDFQTYTLYQAVLAITFGIHFFFFMGTWDIASKIRDGGLDSELLLPGNPLLRVAMGRSETSSVGDMLYGIRIFAALGTANALAATGASSFQSVMSIWCRSWAGSLR